jgi:hypothetical protein
LLSDDFIDTTFSFEFCDARISVATDALFGLLDLTTGT